MKLSTLFSRNHFIKTLFGVLLSAGLLVAAPSFAAKKDAKAQIERIAPINVNRAKASELVQLKGIGEKKAQAIVAYRSKYGKFKTLEEMTEVKGIGEKFIEKNRAQMTL